VSSKRRYSPCCATIADGLDCGLSTTPWLMKIKGWRKMRAGPEGPLS
jgi:hypothetical protein